MRVQLFNDKQVFKVVESIKRQFVINFEKAKDELEALLDAEIKRQTETNVKIQEYIEERKTKRDTVLSLMDLNEQVKAINENYYISNNWKSPSVEGFDQEHFDKNTQNHIEMKAENAAKNALGLDDISYRENCLLDDLTARVAVMNVADYDDVVALLNTKINIKYYFVTL